MAPRRTGAPSACTAVAASRRHLMRGLALGAAGTLARLGTDRAGARARHQDAAGATPVGVRIPRALVDAPLEPRQISAGTMEDPTGIWAAVWYEESGRLGVPGNLLLFGYPDWRGVGPAVFHCLVFLREGAQADVVGDDGHAYRFRVGSVEVLPPEATLPALSTGDAPGEWLTLFTAAAPFDYAAGRYLNYAVVRAQRTDDPPRAVDARTFDAEEALGCVPTVLSELAANPWEVPSSLPAPPGSGPPNPAGFQTIEQIGEIFTQGEPAPRPLVDEIEAQLAETTSCTLSLRRALLLPDGRVVALVGPRGDLALDAVTGVAFPDIDAALPGAHLCGFFVFADEGDRWRAERFYGTY